MAVSISQRFTSILINKIVMDSNRQVKLRKYDMFWVYDPKHSIGTRTLLRGSQLFTLEYIYDFGLFIFNTPCFIKLMLKVMLNAVEYGYQQICPVAFSMHRFICPRYRFHQLLI